MIRIQPYDCVNFISKEEGGPTSLWTWCSNLHKQASKIKVQIDVEKYPPIYIWSWARRLMITSPVF